MLEHSSGEGHPVEVTNLALFSALSIARSLFAQLPFFQAASCVSTF